MMGSILLAGPKSRQKQVISCYLTEQNYCFKELDGVLDVSQVPQDPEWDLIIVCHLEGENFSFGVSFVLPVLFILSPEQLDLLPLTKLPGEMEILLTPFSQEEFFARLQLLKIRRKKTVDFMRESILHQLDDVIYSATLSGELMYLNPSAKEKYGPSLVELIGKRLHFLKNILQETHYNRSEYHLDTIQGPVFLEEKTYLVQDDQGQPLRIDGIVYDITEMKYTERALRQGEAQMRSIITVIPDILIRFSQEGIIKEIWTQEDGSSPFPATLTQKKIQDIWPEEISHLFWHHIRKALQEKELQGFQFQLLHSSRVFIFEARIVASGRDEVVAIIRDVTELRQAEESLRRFRAAMDSSGDLILLMEYQSGRFLDVNDTASLKLGYSRGELLEMDLLDIQPTLSSTQCHELFSSLQRHRKKLEQEGWFQKKNTQSFPVEISFIYLEINSLPIIMASARDITQRLQIQKERDRIFNLSLDMMCILDAQGNFRQINPSWKRTMGWKEEELLQNSLFTYVHPQDAQETQAQFLDLSQGIPVKNLENRYRCQDGTYRWLSFSLFPVLDEGIIVSVARDVTGKKEDQEQLARYAQEMRVTNEKLMEVQDSLKENIAKAGEMHQRFLPRSLPQIPGLSFATYYQPAQRVGGDFYNLVLLGDELLIYVADVSGHGLDGAMLTIFMRENINHYLTYGHQDEKIHPERMLQHLAQQFLQEDFPEDYFICLSLLVLDLKNWELVYSNAGNHIPPRLVDGTGRIEDLKIPGFPISKVIDLTKIQYQKQVIPFSPESTLFVTTDGLIEQFQGDSYYGEGRITRLLAEHHHRPAQELAAAVTADFLAFNGKEQGDDDISFLIMKRGRE